MKTAKYSEQLQGAMVQGANNRRLEAFRDTEEGFGKIKGRPNYGGVGVSDSLGDRILIQQMDPSSSDFR